MCTFDLPSDRLLSPCVLAKFFMRGITGPFTANSVGDLCMIISMDYSQRHTGCMSGELRGALASSGGGAGTCLSFLEELFLILVLSEFVLCIICII